jgi:hypothetical protein
MDSIDDAIKLYNDGKIKPEELIEQIEYNLALSLEGTDRSIHVAGVHPLSKEHNNNRTHISRSYLTTNQGKFFQFAWKKIVLKAIDYIHTSLQKHYDQNIYVFDDPDFKQIKLFSSAFIDTYFTHCKPYKSDFMYKIMDIVLGIAKEDPYYCARLKLFLSKFIEHFPDGFKLTESEKRNIEAWK